MLHLDLKLSQKLEKKFVELVKKKFNGSYDFVLIKRPYLYSRCF